MHLDILLNLSAKLTFSDFCLIQTLIELILEQYFFNSLQSVSNALVWRYSLTYNINNTIYFILYIALSKKSFTVTCTSTRQLMLIVCSELLFDLLR